ncbi:hypothetical protein [Moorena sp. SIOASIH]|nr:hypothetical protein [Moorena sp. SIOASIH]
MAVIGNRESGIGNRESGIGNRGQLSAISYQLCGTGFDPVT